MLLRRSLLAPALLLTLSACAPQTQFKATHLSQETPQPASPVKGVWLKKSLADNFRSQGPHECGTLVATTPTAFRIDVDGTIQLITASKLDVKPITIGQVSADGKLKGPNLFESFALNQDMLMAQSAADEKPTEYVRSRPSEVAHVFDKIENCLANLKLETSPSDLENQAVLAKNKIELARQKAMGRDVQDRALAFLFVGTFVAIDTAERLGFENLAIQAAQLGNLVNKDTFNHELRLINQDFDAFRERVAQRINQKRPWASNTSVDDMLPAKNPTEFDGSYNNLVRSHKTMGEVGADSGQVQNGKYYVIRPGGKIELTQAEKVELQALKDRYVAVPAQVPASDYIKQKAVAKAEKSLMYRRGVGAAVILAIAGAEIYHIWERNDVKAKTEEVARLVSINDDELRAEIRKNPELAQLLIQTEKTLKE